MPNLVSLGFYNSRDLCIQTDRRPYRQTDVAESIRFGILIKNIHMYIFYGGLSRLFLPLTYISTMFV